MERIGDLQIDQDLPFQQREWTAERAAWVALVALVALAALGLFGRGPLSWSSAASDDGLLVVDYERFGRRGAPQRLVVEAGAAAAHAGQWEIDLSHGYVTSVRVDAVTPTPESVESVEGGLRYTFSQAHPDADLAAIFSVTPDALWNRRAAVRLAGGDWLDIGQFFFP